MKAVLTATSNAAVTTEAMDTASSVVPTSPLQKSEENPHGPVYASCFGDEGLVVYVLNIDTGKTTDIASFPSYGGGYGACLDFNMGSRGQEARPNFNSDFTQVAVSLGGDGIGYMKSGTDDVVNVSRMGKSGSPFVAFHAALGSCFRFQ